MTSLKNLTSKIIKDSENKAKNILEEAKKEEKRILNEEIKNAQRDKIELIKKANIESQNKRERIISNAHLNVRNEKLNAKQNTINKVYEEALKILTSLPKEKYLSFIKSSILGLSIIGDEEIILSQDENKINNELIDNINKELGNKGKKGELKLSKERRIFKGGFILARNGIEINYTFEGLISSLKDELEPAIIDILFS